MKLKVQKFKQISIENFVLQFTAHYTSHNYSYVSTRYTIFILRLHICTYHQCVYEYRIYLINKMSEKYFK